MKPTIARFGGKGPSWAERGLPPPHALIVIDPHRAKGVENALKRKGVSYEFLADGVILAERAGDQMDRLAKLPGVKRVLADTDDENYLDDIEVADALLVSDPDGEASVRRKLREKGMRHASIGHGLLIVFEGSRDYYGLATEVGAHDVLPAISGNIYRESGYYADEYER